VSNTNPTFARSEREQKPFDHGLLLIEYENADIYFSDSDELIKWIDQPNIVPFIKYISYSK